MIFVKIPLLIGMLAYSIACSNFKQGFLELKEGQNGAEVTASGVFDLKSIRLNAGPKNKVDEDYCKGYFSESSEPNASSVEMDLIICTDELRTNCLDRLPEDAPPEVIVIRNRYGKAIGHWASTQVKFETKTFGKENKI